MTIVILPNSVFGEPLGNIPRSAKIERQEFVNLPKWCQIRMMAHPRIHHLEGSENVPGSIMRQSAMYEKSVGKDIYPYAHHYCRGINWINRYKHSLPFNYKNIERDRDYALNYSIGEFRFMRGHLTPAHKLYYSMLMYEAYVYSEQKDYRKALKNYGEIIQRKPKYPVAYIKYAEILNTTGQKEEAKKILQSGLENTKGDPAIKQALGALGGTSAN